MQKERPDSVVLLARNRQNMLVLLLPNWGFSPFPKSSWCHRKTSTYVYELLSVCVDINGPE